MRIKYSLQDIRSYYKRLLKWADYYYEKGSYNQTIQCIRASAILQYNLNDIFSDSQANGLLKQLSSSLVYKDQSKFIPNKDCVFFIDFFGIDNRGLTQQYLDAIIHSGQYKKIVYIHESILSNNSKSIRNTITNNRVELVELGYVCDLNKIKLLCNTIEQYKPKDAFFHIHPAKSIAPLVSFYAYPDIVKYQINITDHAFWLGGPDFFHYVIDFRQYGASITRNKRGFSINQIMMLPYYPWQESSSFAGFPVDIKDKLVLFAGGYLYKIEDDECTFLNIIKAIIGLDERVVFLMAGSGDTHYFDEYVKNNCLHNKFFYIGNRSDISEVIRRIDLFIGTYPIGGGLMTQLAAIEAKPIMLYKSYRLRELFVKMQEVDFIYDTKEDLLDEAHKLIKDEDYRKSRGAFACSLVNTQEKFRSSFNSLMTNGCECDTVNNETTDMSHVYSSYLARINKGFSGVYLDCLMFKASGRFIGLKPLLNIFLNIHQVLRLAKDR